MIPVVLFDYHLINTSSSMVPISTLLKETDKCTVLYWLWVVHLCMEWVSMVPIKYIKRDWHVYSIQYRSTTMVSIWGSLALPVVMAPIIPISYFLNSPLTPLQGSRLLVASSSLTTSKYKMRDWYLIALVYYLPPSVLLLGISIVTLAVLCSQFIILVLIVLYKKPLPFPHWRNRYNSI